MTDFKKLSQDAFESATTYIDANYRQEWDYSLKAFRSEHAPGSKYLSDEYKSRSRLFRPKTRAIIRKQEAAASVALFSNVEVVNLTPGNPDDMMSVASCEAMKAVLEYRLTHTIPAYQVCLGGFQDAQVTGTVCSYQYWEYETRGGRKVKDQPCIELRPIENLRLDAGASWLDPVNTTPYFCDIIPMYVCDVRALMKNKDEKTGAPKWKALEDSQITRAQPDVMDSTRRARLGKMENPEEKTTGIKAFDIVWVLRWFMRDSQGVDHTYYTMGTEDLLTEAKPIDEVYFHGKRPYVMGYAILETHKALKTSMPMLAKPLQQETNDVANQRLDNVKFVLNKRWLVARGRQVDVQSLVRNVPGGVTLTTDPKTDVQESNWPDVTASAYMEQDRLNADFDDIAGNFSPNTKVANKGMNDTLGGSRMAAQGAGMMSDYLLRTVIETWWEPALRQLVLLEQYYETDSVVLALAAKKARLFPRFGLSQVTDDMLMSEVNLNVNVGMGSSNPQERMQRFLMASKAAIDLMTNAPPSLNSMEMAKEIFSNAGFRDGARFMRTEEDPQLAQAMQQIQQLQQALEGKQMDIEAEGQIKQLQIGSNEKIKAAELQIDAGRIQGDLRIREAELVVEQQKLEIEAAKLELEKLKIQVDAGKADREFDLKAEEVNTTIAEAGMRLEGEKQKLIGLAAKIAHEDQQAQLELANAQVTGENEARVREVTDSVGESMQSVREEVSKIRESSKAEMDGVKEQMRTMHEGIALMAGAMAKPKRSAKGFKLKKSDGKKTSAIVIEYTDGSSDEMQVGSA